MARRDARFENRRAADTVGEWLNCQGDTPREVLDRANRDSAPTAASQMQFVTVGSRTPHTINFETVDAGKTVHYWLRWVSTRNQRGPWGAPIHAMILG